MTTQPKPEPDPTDPQCRPCDGDSGTCPVDLGDGSVELGESYLDTPHSGNFRLTWYNRWNNGGTPANFVAGVGNNWSIDAFAYVTNTVNGELAFVWQPGRSGKALWFSKSGNGYTAKFGARQTLTRVGNQWRITEPDGTVWEFSLIDQLISRMISPGGQVTQYFKESAKVVEKRRTDGDDVEARLFDYNNDGNLHEVILYHGTVAQSHQTPVRKIAFAYYIETEPGKGNPGDLKTVATLVPDGDDWQEISTDYYRYYTETSPQGFVGGLKYVVDPAAYAGLPNPETATDAEIAAVAKVAYQYDPLTHRAIASDTHGGTQSFTVEYTESQNFDGYNNWQIKAVASLPDGSTKTVFANHLGQDMLVDDQHGNDRWITYTRFNDDGRTEFVAEPSAIEMDPSAIDMASQPYDENSPDLAVQLNANKGLIRRTTYYGEAATAPTYPEFRQVQRGSAGTPINLNKTEYESHTADGETIYPVKKRIAYRSANSGGSDPVTTSFTNEFFSNSTQLRKITEHLPDIDGSQNRGAWLTGNTSQTQFDIHGRPNLTTDPLGVETSRSYNDATGTLSKTIQDVAGLVITTDLESDLMGRPTKTIGPPHQLDGQTVRTVTWINYLDAEHQVRTASGHQAEDGSGVLINPVTINQQDASGRVIDEIQAVRGNETESSGELTAADDFPQSSWTRWTHNIYTPGNSYRNGRLDAIRVYHTIPATGDGQPGTHYNQTDFGYDSMSRHNRVRKANGTITRTVFNTRGLPTATWIGTNDAGAADDDPTGDGTSGNDMIQLTGEQYDHGRDGGNGILTRDTKLVDDDPAHNRITHHESDWRDRPNAKVAIGPETNIITRDTLDNLGQVNQTDSLSAIDGVETLFARDRQDFDDRGNVFASHRDGVDQATGALTGNTITVNRKFDARGSVLRQTPAGPADFILDAYDALARRITVTDALGAVASTTYNAASWITAQTNPLGNITLLNHDGIGRTIASTDPVGNTSHTEFNPAGDVAANIDPMGGRVSLAHDATGDEISRIDQAGNVWAREYNDVRQLARTINPLGDDVEMEYDLFGNQIRTTDEVGDVTQQLFNRAGDRIESIDAKGSSTLYGFNTLGQHAITTDRIGGVTLFGHDRAGGLSSLTDADGSVTQYGFDEFRRKFTTLYPDHVPGTQPGQPGYDIVTTGHDQRDRLSLHTDQLGDTMAPVYNATGLTIARQYRTLANSPTGPIADTDSFTFDAASQMLTATSGRYDNTVNFHRDAAGNLILESITLHGQTFTFTAQYNGNSQLTKLTLPDGTVLDRDYDPRRLLTQFHHNGTLIDTRGYDAASRLATSNYHNGVSTDFTDRADGLLTQINTTTPAPTPVGDLSYQWDANKNKTSETITGPLSGYGFNQTSYDADDRLIGWQRTDNNLDQSWQLSSVGDWNAFTENAAIQTRTHNAVHEITSVTPPATASETVTHDNKGNTTLIPPSLRTANSSAANLPLSLSWDFENYLLAATVSGTPPDPNLSVQFEYDALKRRVSRTNSTNTTLFINFGQQVFADYTAPSSGTIDVNTPDFTYVYGSYIDEVTFRSGSNGPRYFHRNQQYSTIALTDGGGNVAERYAYEAYGTPTITDAGGTVRTASAENNRYLYTGREWDEVLGLYHYRARMYDPAAGRLCSRDPIGFAGGINLFQYAIANPLAKGDPTGNAPFAGFIECCKRTYVAEGWSALCFGSAGTCAIVCFNTPPLCGQCMVAAGIIMSASCIEMVNAWEHACDGGCVPGC